MNITGDPKLIASAFVKARGEMSATVIKDGKGNFGKYATLAAIVEATAPAFANHGLAIVQEASADEHGICVETWLVHESGATMQFTPLTMPLTDRKPQAVGSALTYARRYALGAICGLAPDDDDGQEAQDAQKQVTKPSQSAQRPQNGTQAQHRHNAANKNESPPHTRLWGIGKAVLGTDWDMARPWVIKQWTKNVTPDNIRSSASDLSDDEKSILGDYMNEKASTIQQLWPKQKAIIVQAHDQQPITESA